MKSLLSPLIGWVWIVGGSLVPLSGVHWVEQNGRYGSFPSGDARQAKSLENWRQPIAVLGLPAGAPSYNLLPPPAREWLQRLGVVAQDGSRLSVVAVLHAPGRYPWSITERLWYRHDIRPGIVAVKLIPLSKGQIDWLEPWDFKPTPNVLSVRSLPNDFVKRKFPCPHPERGNHFRIKFSGAEEHEPMAYASLVMDTAGKAHVAVEIIPPVGTVFQTLGDVEDILKRFLNPAHPVWHQRSTQPWRPTAISPAAGPPLRK